MNRKLLSIIIAVYNTEKYLGQCLDSILCQQVDTDSYEVICIDDCSTDSSYDILLEYASRYKNLKILQTEEGGKGPSRVRNIGLNNASGKYIWFIDSDDYIKNNSLPSILALLDIQKPQLINIGFENMSEGQQPCNELTGELRWSYKDATRLSYTFTGIVDVDLLNKSWNGGRFVEGIFYGEDELLWLGVFCQQEEKTLLVDNKIYNYRIGRPGSLMSQVSQKNSESRAFHDKRFDSILLVLKNINDLCQTDIQEGKMVYVEQLYEEYLGSAITSVLPNTSYKRSLALKKLKESAIKDKKQYKIFIHIRVKYRLSKFILFRFLNKIRHRFIG